MKFLANENFPWASTLLLRSLGHEVIAIGIDYPGAFDEEVIRLSNAKDLTILTFDSDYGNLIFHGQLRPTKGVIYLRLENYSPTDPGKLVDQIAKKLGENLFSSLTVVTETSIRQRSY